MGYTGTGALGTTYIGQGVGAGGTFKPIGTSSGLATHGVLISQGLNAFTSVIPSSTSGAVLQSRGAASDPQYSTAAYPITAGTSGNVLTSDGTNWTSAAPSGGVTGPGSSTDRAIATWNGTGGTALFNNATVTIDSTGRMLNSAQPAFLAFLGTTDSNVTGDGTTFTLGSGNALTKVFDQGNNFNTNGTFTAPVTGRYFLQFYAYVAGGTIVRDGGNNLNTSNRTYQGFGSYYASAGGTVSILSRIATLADMDAADTATYTISWFDTGGKIDDVIGAATNPQTWVSGYLVC